MTVMISHMLNFNSNDSERPGTLRPSFFASPSSAQSDAGGR